MLVRFNTCQGLIRVTHPFEPTEKLVFIQKDRGKITRPPSTPTPSLKLEWDENRTEQKQSANTLSSDTDGGGVRGASMESQVATSLIDCTAGFLR